MRTFLFNCSYKWNKYTDWQHWIEFKGKTCRKVPQVWAGGATSQRFLWGWEGEWAGGHRPGGSLRHRRSRWWWSSVPQEWSSRTIPGWRSCFVSGAFLDVGFLAGCTVGSSITCISHLIRLFRFLWATSYYFTSTGCCHQHCEHPIGWRWWWLASRRWRWERQRPRP